MTALAATGELTPCEDITLMAWPADLSVLKSRRRKLWTMAVGGLFKVARRGAARVRNNSLVV